jgi:phosphoribosylformimino-5-aminoimidazole carboxamide ribonucleotide (ProFAR) isomerase
MLPAPRYGAAVGFEVIPAIDVSGGRLARFTTEGPVAIEDFGGDPVTAAESFLSAGAGWLHLVDMDLAFTGTALNIDTVMAVRRVALFAGAKIQAGGAIARQDDVDHLLDVGADRVVLGSSILVDRELVERLTVTLGERIVVGLEVDGDRIRSRGRDPVDLALGETLSWLADTRCARFLLTAVRRVGSLAGPDLGALESVLALGRPVVAAGGIADLDDLRAVRAAGGEGAVVGRAAMEAGLDLAAALALAAG